MSKDRKAVVHIHSNVNDKQPTPQTLRFGELGVNYATNNAFLSTKNSAGEVIRFSEDGTLINWMEYKTVFPYKAEVRGSAGDVITDRDLSENTSNLVFKINQKVAPNTVHHGDVNNATDVFGNPISQMSADGTSDGAGFAVDMSGYAMIGANPSFSSVTATYQSALSGTTGIYGTLVGDGDSATLSFCDGFSVKSDDISFSSCTSGNGEFTINTGDVTVGATNVGVVAEATNVTSRSFAVEAEDACIVGTRKINVYGDETYVGVDCDDTTERFATNTVVKGSNISVSGITTDIKGDSDVTVRSDGSLDISGRTTNIISSDTTDIKGMSGVTVRSDGNLGISGDTTDINGISGVTIHSDGGLDISGRTICERALVDAAFFGMGKTIIGMTCDGSSVASEDIVIGRTPSTIGSQLSATTVDGAIEEAFNRSKVTMTVVEHTAGSELLKTYKLFQDGVQIGQDINIPKDHVLKDAEIVYGNLNGTTFTPCASGATGCHYYIKLTWNVFNPSTGHADDKVSYLPCDKFIQVVEAYNAQSNGIKTTVTLEDGKYKVSGSTNVSVAYGDNWNHIQTADQGLNEGFVLSAYTLNVNVLSGTPTEHTETYDAFHSGKTIDIVVPNSITHLNEYTSGSSGENACLALGDTDICFSGGKVVAQNFYATSDRGKKENIEPLLQKDYSKADSVSFKTFNFKDDADKKKMYGVIAQDVVAAGLEDVVETDADGTLSVDYTSMLILKIASLEARIEAMHKEISELKEK